MTCGVVTLPRYVVELQCAWRCLVLLLAPVACGVQSFWPVALHLECFLEATCWCKGCSPLNMRWSRKNGRKYEHYDSCLFGSSVLYSAIEMTVFGTEQFRISKFQWFALNTFRSSLKTFSFAWFYTHWPSTRTEENYRATAHLFLGQKSWKMLDEVTGHYHHQLFSLPSWLPCCLDFLCWSGSTAASFGSFVALVVLQTLGDLLYVQQPRAGTKLHQPEWAIMKLGSSCATRTFCHLTAAWNFAWKFWYLLCSSAFFGSYTHIDHWYSLGGYGSKKIVPKAQQIWSSSVFTIRTHTMIYLLYIYSTYYIIIHPF